MGSTGLWRPRRLLAALLATGLLAASLLGAGAALRAAQVGDELYFRGDANTDGSLRVLVVADTDGDGIPDGQIQLRQSGQWLNLTLAGLSGGGGGSGLPETPLSLAHGGTAATSAAAARTSLGLGTAATQATGTFAAVANNLSDLASIPGARTSLGLATVASSGAYTDLSGKPTLGGAASLNVGTTAGSVAAGDDSRITGAAAKASNLSDLASAATARTNLGLATVASSGSYTDLSSKPTIATALTGLSDYPANYTGKALYIPRVNAGATALEFVAPQVGYLDDWTGPSGGAYYSSAAITGINSNVTLTANTGLYFPFLLLKRRPFTLLGLQVTTLVAGSSIEVALYAFDASTTTKVGSRLATSGTLSSATVGLKTGAISLTLDPGWYFGRVISDGAPAVRASLQGVQTPWLTDTASGIRINGYSKALGSLVTAPSSPEDLTSGWTAYMTGSPTIYLQ